MHTKGTFKPSLKFNVIAADFQGIRVACTFLSQFVSVSYTWSVIFLQNIKFYSEINFVILIDIC